MLVIIVITSHAILTIQLYDMFLAEERLNLFASPSVRSMVKLFVRQHTQNAETTDREETMGVRRRRLCTTKLICLYIYRLLRVYF